MARLPMDACYEYEYSLLLAIEIPTMPWLTQFSSVVLFVEHDQRWVVEGWYGSFTPSFRYLGISCFPFEPFLASGFHLCAQCTVVARPLCLIRKSKAMPKWSYSCKAIDTHVYFIGQNDVLYAILTAWKVRNILLWKYHHSGHDTSLCWTVRKR